MKCMSTILLLLLLWPFARANAQESARDAYLEAWFQETAEGNLEAALKEYKRCVTLAGDDRELAARASWRMARIARARGDEEAAQLQLQQVIDRYPDTQAASAAQADLTAPAAEEQEGREAAAVEEARRMLREMLGAENVTSPRARSVFRTLSVEEILATHETLGGDLTLVILRLNDPDYAESLVDVLLVRDDDTVQQVCLQGLTGFPSFHIPERLRTRLPELQPATMDWVQRLLTSRPDGAGLPILRELIDGVPHYREKGPLFEDLKTLLGVGDPKAVPVLDRVLDLLFQQATFADWENRSSNQLLSDTPAARHAMERLGEFPAAFRLRVATEAIGKAKGELPREWLDRFLADSEPLVRRQGILGLFQSGDPMRRQEGIDRFLAEGKPYDLMLVDLLVRLPWGDPPPLEELMRLPEGVLREAVYWYAFRDERRSMAQVLRFGLDRKDPELLDALLLPTLAADPGVAYRGKQWEGTTDVSGAGRRLAQSLSSSTDANIGRDLTNAVSARKDLELRKRFVDFLGDCWRLDSFAGAVDQMANDPSATVRCHALGGPPFDRLLPETRVARLLDADSRVASVALTACTDPEALAAACASAELDRLHDLCQKALDRNWPRAVRAAYERLPDRDPLAVPCFEFLWQGDLSVLLHGLRRQDDVRFKALQVLCGLPLPEDLGQLAKQTTTPESYAALADELTKRLPEVEEAFRVFRIQGILQDHEDASPQEDSEYTLDGERLAALNARGELVRLARSDLERDQVTGAAGMVRLGMKDELLAAIRDGSEPSRLLASALQLGLGDELIRLVQGDGLSATSLARAAREAMRGDVLARLLLPEGDQGTPVDLFADPSSFDNLSTCLGYAADFLTREQDAAGLVALVERYGSVAAVNGLLQLQAYDPILAGIGHWTRDPVQIAVVELHRLTGLPKTEPNKRPVWPEFQADQQALIEGWRKALTL